MYAIEITHKSVGDIFGDTTTPTLISNDSDIIDLMFLYKEKQGMSTTLMYTGAYVYSLCSEYYTLDYWLLVYAETIYHVPPESQWHNISKEVRAIKVVEPDVKMFRGRPRLTCFPSQGEYIVKKYKCVTCGQKGHNSKKCPKLSHPSNVRCST